MTIVVAGGTGLAGSAIVRAYVAAGHEVIPVSRKVVDLLDRDATFDFIASVKPTLVIDAAAKVGGIGAPLITVMVMECMPPMEFSLTTNHLVAVKHS